MWVMRKHLRMMLRGFWFETSWVVKLFARVKKAGRKMLWGKMMDSAGKLLSQNSLRIPAGVAHWIECQPVNKGVAGLIPSRGTCLGCRLGPQRGTRERQPHIDVSLSFSLPSLKISF